MTFDLGSYLQSMKDLADNKPVFIETDGVPEGSLSFGEIAMASFTLATRLAANSGDEDALVEAVQEAMMRGDDALFVLQGALLMLTQNSLEPAYKLLDGTSTDQRARSKKEWAVLKETSEGS